jgi:hypothetical protein
MKMITLFAVSAILISTGSVSTAYAALSDRDGTTLRIADTVKVAARGDRGGRSDGGRKSGARADRSKGGKTIWRVRDGKHRSLFDYRGRGDCKTRAVEMRDRDGNAVVRNRWVCN